MHTDEQSITFYLGGYGGFDEFAYNCAKKYKETHSSARLIFVTPYITEEYQRNRLCDMKNFYDGIIYPELERVPKKFAITYRNKYMARSADLVIAYITHDYGGAYSMYKEA